MIFPGEIRLFASTSSPPFNWLICNGALLARKEYSTLFQAIGTLCGRGVEGETYFRLPDLRGRVALGADELGDHVAHTKYVGKVRGHSVHVLTVAQIPAHVHQSGTLNARRGGEHTHSYDYPGHNHGGHTGSNHFAHGGSRGCGSKGEFLDWKHHTHTIQTDRTWIMIHAAGAHGHSIDGTTAAEGQGQQFGIMHPYQTVDYIIYAGSDLTAPAME
ncbi:unnamed protein product [Rotaria sp. Silwood2]|nr:unnamed protein product [Rotaria sp. Silwood2]CAF3052453.1 unnamed protein product [Rotaria sp. Silwood2]CAF3467780.1 unnamed protein product [Rotaria sp. Silwood2]CAF4261697.1 unnamed protein product [Rotaria sp. Silwood2]CAF4460513.1 unnamed protein product [Rotaria sp. Silwood2]